MKPFDLFSGLLIGSILSLSACNDTNAQIKPPTDTSTIIKPAQNKMVALPSSMKLGMAVVHPPRAKDGFGNMNVQTIGTFNGLHNLLVKQNMNLGNVMSLRVTLVADATGKVDYDGYMTGYKKFFGTQKMPSEPVYTISAARSLPVTGQLIIVEAGIAIPVAPKITLKQQILPQKKADK